MKKQIMQIMALFLTALFLTVSCTKDEDPPSDDTNPPPTPTHEINKYIGCGSYGDIIRYEIDETNMTISYYNETTGESGSGSYTLTGDNNISGVYEAIFDGETYYAIELAEEIMATSAPSGRLSNRLCYAISADQDLSTDYSVNDLVGKYLYIIYDDFEDEVYGGYELYADGTYSWNVGPDDEDNFDENIHFAGGGGGSWAISPTDPSRVIFTEGGVNYTGSILPEKAMLIDGGVGNGYIAGIKYPGSHATQLSVAGSYRILDVTSEGTTGVGTYSIPASGGNLQYYLKYTDGLIDQGTANDFAPVSAINNMFRVSASYEGEIFYTWFVLLPGELMLHFCAGEDTGLVSYGIGAKIN